MAAPAPTYDLMLLLDLSATDAARAKIVTDTKATIESAGTLVSQHDWGAKALAYHIDRREQAEYHLFQFQGPASLPGSLERTLRITDGVVRHRIIKLAPGTPPPPQGHTPPPAPAEVAPAEVAPAEAAPAEVAAVAAPAADSADVADA